jgi:hypothetical protein
MWKRITVLRRIIEKHHWRNNLKTAEEKQAREIQSVVGEWNRICGETTLDFKVPGNVANIERRVKQETRLQ